MLLVIKGFILDVIVLFIYKLMFLKLHVLIMYFQPMPQAKNLSKWSIGARINAHLQEFTEGRNHHSLSTEENMSPVHLSFWVLHGIFILCRASTTIGMLKVHVLCTVSCKFNHRGFKSNILIVLQKGPANHCIAHQ